MFALLNIKYMQHFEQAIVVLGMHRSGTSAVAGTAARLGFSPPATLIEASGANPGGYYESYPIVYINHQLLHAAGCTWDACLGFNPAEIARFSQTNELDMMTQTLQQEFATSGTILLKDPRLCLTLPAWLPTLQAACSRLAVLIVLRRPAAVARSLAVRNQTPEAVTLPHWLHHMLEAERSTRGLPRGILFYDELLRDWRRCITRAGRSAGISWPLPAEQAASAIASFLDAPSSHPVADNVAIGPAPISNWIESTWTSFRMLSENPLSAVALPYLDHIHAEFAAWRRQTQPAS